MTAPDGRPQGADTPTVVEMTPAEDAWYWWEHAQSGVDTPGCDCGHDGMGPAWHTADCRGAATAYRRKARELHGALAASGGTAAPTDEQVADALRVWHDLTANQRATWDRLHPRWSLAAFIAHHLRVALAARAPQPAPDEETNDAR